MFKYAKKYASFWIFIISTCLVCSLRNCSGSNEVENVGNVLGSPEENITVTTEAVNISEGVESGSFRGKRSFPIYKCQRTRCTGSECKPESYEGPHPPDWCRHGRSHKKETKCSWTKSCRNKHCEVQSTSCRHQYQDLRNGGSLPETTFNFECFTRTKQCNVEQCKGLNNCKKKASISIQKFKNDFLNRLPNCNEVDRKVRSKRKLEQAILRRKRTPPSVLAFQGYCCEIGERWAGVTIAHVRPKIS